MAQTVALQRGTNSTTSNNTNVTLFTQSGGISTRVILNNLGFTFPGNVPNTGTMSAMLCLNQTGGQSYWLGLIRLNVNYNRAMQFIGASSPDNQNIFFPLGTSGNVVQNVPFITSNGTNGVASSNANNLDYQQPTTSGTRQNACLTNFYMGPSDSVSIKIFAQFDSGSDVTNPPVSISYSFTTITES